MTNTQQDRAEFLAARRKGIGGSDVAPILGISPFATPLDVWRSKVLGDEQPEDPLMKWGKLLEPAIREEARVRLAEMGEDVTGPALCMDEPMNLSPGDVCKYPNIFANLDGYVGHDAILECKNVNAYAAHGWGIEGTDEIPDAYLCQVAWYLMVTARSLAHVAVLIGGHDFRMYRVARNIDLERKILESCVKWWRDHVATQTPPPPSNLQDCRRQWRQEIAGKSVAMTPDLQAALVEMKAAQAAGKECEDTVERCKFRLMAAMGDAECIVDADGTPLVTWKRQVRKSYVVKESESRVLRVTKWAQPKELKP